MDNNRVIYIEVNKENYLQKRDYFKNLLKKGYRFKQEPLYLVGDTRILVFFKLVTGGIFYEKAEGESIIIWRLLADMRKEMMK